MKLSLVINNMKKYLFTFLALLLLAKLNAQEKKTDTIYYLLDTAKVPVNDRMFHIESEGPFMFYSLQCKCFPYGYGIGFYHKIANKKEKEISFQEFRQVKTVSIIELIDLAVDYLTPANRNKYQFIFVEPEGNHFRLIDMKIWIPTKPRKTTTITTIEPIKN